jgi:HPt (histidine-containing phosphotransfer) domain-containing protein
MDTKQDAAVVFDPDVAIEHCCHSAKLVGEMIQYFFNDVDNVLPRMRVALQTGNLVEVGQLGHRLKGTLVYLGAKSAEEAAQRVERFGRPSDGTLSGAVEAINALERECLALKALLIAHPLTAKAKQND